MTNWLTAEGVTLGDRIAVCVPRSEELIVVQQAILAAGAVYVPVDPDYPEGRIHYMLESSAPKFVFSTSALQDKLPQGVELKLVDNDTLPTIYKRVEPLPPQVKPEPHSPAYMIYTSGSTGKPKVWWSPMMRSLTDCYGCMTNIRLLRKIACCKNACGL